MFFVINDQKVSLGSFLGYLKDEHKRLEDAILALEKLPDLLPQLTASVTTTKSKGAKGHPAGASNPGGDGIYAGFPAQRAAADCLRRAGKPLPTKDLVARMLAGGFITRARNFEANLYTVLAHRPDLFSKISPGVWSLAKAS